MLLARLLFLAASSPPDVVEFGSASTGQPLPGHPISILSPLEGEVLRDPRAMLSFALDPSFAAGEGILPADALMCVSVVYSEGKDTQCFEAPQNLTLDGLESGNYAVMVR
jgi:hypothetical protein